MTLWLRIVLWVIVAVVPGGLLLAPVLIGDEIRRRRLARAHPAEPEPADAALSS